MFEELYKQNYPEDLGYALACHETNAFGFQAVGAGEPGTLIVAKLWMPTVDPGTKDWTEENKTAELLKGVAESKTAQVIEWLGRWFVSVHFTEWNLIPKVLQYLLDRGDVGITTHNALTSAFPPKSKFSWEEMEKRAIQRMRDLAVEFKKTLAGALMFVNKKHAYLDHYNWQTAAGKAFCTELRQSSGLKPFECTEEQPFYTFKQFNDVVCRKYKVLHRGDWSAYEPSMGTTDKLIYKTEHLPCS